MGTNLPVKSSCFEIIIVLIFLTLYLFIRIIGVIQFGKLPLRHEKQIIDLLRDFTQGTQKNDAYWVRKSMNCILTQ